MGHVSSSFTRFTQTAPQVSPEFIEKKLVMDSPSRKNPFHHASIHRMGALVQTQVECALMALTRPTKGDVALALRREDQINALEREVLHECEAASSLVSLDALTAAQRISLARAAKDLERMGDEAKKIIAKSLIVQGENFIALDQTPPIMCMAHHACQSAARAIAVLDDLEVLSAQKIIEADLQIDAELDEVMAQIVEIIHATPLAARSGIDVVFIAKAWERIGDHAKNLAENVIEMGFQQQALYPDLPEPPKLIWTDEHDSVGV
jgi:phosphate transport system protein